jgi:polyribonucleotide nucleotidyltransferase
MFPVTLYTANLNIHPSAMGHVIGKRGKTIRGIRQRYSVSTQNTCYYENQDGYVQLTIQGRTRNDVQKAIFEIDDLIAVSNRWCRTNGVVYE